ncbi:hypothetical protein [Pseudomonas syringae]|nr:hypothetical protein [Pseudomonas syringae]
MRRLRPCLRLAVRGVEVLHRHYAGQVQVHSFIEVHGTLDTVEGAT